MVREWRAGDRVALSEPAGDLARLHGVRGTLVDVDGAVAVVRFDSPKLLGGKFRSEVAVATAWLVEVPPPGLVGGA